MLVCDIGGDAFNWVMQDEGISFPEALQKLAERAGITLEATDGRKKPRTSPDEKAALFKVMNWASDLYHKFLFDTDGGAAARKYLEERGLLNESVRQFQVGLAPRAGRFCSIAPRRMGSRPRSLRQPVSDQTRSWWPLRPLSKPSDLSDS